MVLFIVLLITEVLSILVIQQHLFYQARFKHLIAIIIHVILSLWIFFFFFSYTYYNSFYDNPRHVWLMMNLTGMCAAVVFPRIILIIMHFTGKLIKLKSRSHLRWLTNTGMALSALIMLILAVSAFYERFNFTTEEITINIKGLNHDLDGLRIVQISDMHLSSFYHNEKQLEKVMGMVNQLHPDLFINTGDFVSFGWREFDRYDTIFTRAKSKYGNFAILGNHDVGTYDPYFSEAERDNNILIMNNLIQASGYQVLNDQFRIVKIGKAKIGMIGVVTGGRHPHMTHGNLDKALVGLDSVDLEVLLSHDPNHWMEAVEKKTDIDLTLSGHTHGMQMGIITKKFRWSPAKYFYPHWNGLYNDGNQYHYVNRGLGCLAIPFRIWMPPEITVITLKTI